MPNSAETVAKTVAEALYIKLSFPKQSDCCKHCDVDDYSNWTLCQDCQIVLIIDVLTTFAAQQVHKVVEKANATNGRLGDRLKRIECLMKEVAKDLVEHRGDGSSVWASKYQCAAFVVGVREAEARVWEEAALILKESLVQKIDAYAPMVTPIVDEFLRRALIAKRWKCEADNAKS